MAFHGELDTLSRESLQYGSSTIEFAPTLESTRASSLELSAIAPGQDGLDLAAYEPLQRLSHKLVVRVGVGTFDDVACSRHELLDGVHRQG